MNSLSVRINKETRNMLEQLSEKMGASLTAVVEDAVKELHRKKFWEDVARAYEEMRNDPEESRAYDEEIKLFEGTLADGLEEDK